MESGRTTSKRLTGSRMMKKIGWCIDEANGLKDELGGKVNIWKKTVIWIQYDETLATKQKG